MSRARIVALALALLADGAMIGWFIVLAVSGGTSSSVAQQTHYFPLPELHGQASWPPGKRRAPDFALRDQDGRLVSLEALRQRPVLLTFLDSRCQSPCPSAARQLSMVLRRLPAGERPTLAIVSLDPAGDTPASIRQTMKTWRLDGPWRWYWLRGTKRRLSRVWQAYGVAGRPTTEVTLYLIDRSGFERTGYVFPFAPGFVELDLRRLAAEPA